MDILFNDKPCKCGSYNFIVFYGGEFVKCQKCNEPLKNKVEISSCSDMWGNKNSSYKEGQTIN